MQTRSRILLLSLLAAAACGKLPDAPGELAASNKQRILTVASPADLAATVSGTNTFAFDLYRQVASASTNNVFLSPYSVSVALAMTYAGAAGDTAKAFEQVLHNQLPQAQFHRAMNDLDSQLQSRGQGKQGSDGKPFRLTAANQLFAQKGFQLETTYLDTLALEYGANVRLLDFVNAAEMSRTQINTWVAQRTENRIDELLPPGFVGPDTATVLVNAVYFNAAWKTKFDKALTHSGSFQNADGSKATVEHMKNEELTVRAATFDSIELVELPYDGEELSMLVVMPPLGALTATEAALSNEKIATYLAALHSEALTLSMPKFSFKTSQMLANVLKAMGLSKAFVDADFSAMSKTPVEVSEVVHDTFVQVNESGTEAAAATAVGTRTVSIPQTRSVNLDHPFLFLIRDQATGSVVFIGRVNGL